MKAPEVACCGSTFALYVLIVIGLVAFAGLMAGLTLGLMSLGLVDFEVLMKSGRPKDRIHASKIFPVVKKVLDVACEKLKSLAKAKQLDSSLILLINSAWAAAKESTTMKNEPILLLLSPQCQPTHLAPTSSRLVIPTCSKLEEIKSQCVSTLDGKIDDHGSLKSIKKML
ncbi:DUF21 domain-containing protein [Camellia lanceoleosa]|uniref:DUF21 domain-containing protein n=1 Tax=Camellia lanceoleosa TaxID=1840588 RepID=A0ACC0HFM9_9ERIC|nr:DUF21 domain-containing protein [Camellia lanceoleosa]